MIAAECYTDCGGRPHNEDQCTYGRENGIFYALAADGLGGHGGGAYASAAAIQEFQECIRQRKPGKLACQELEEWFSAANRIVLDMQTAECQMKTTMAALCIDETGHTAIQAHLGDSRIYHFVDKAFASCTFDHSVSRMAVLAGEIRMEEIRFHADRNKLLKVVGKSADTKAETEEIILEKNHRHDFLLCTDGFWEYVTEKEMEKALAHAKNPGDWLAKMRAGLVKRAPQNNDNHSAVAVFV